MTASYERPVGDVADDRAVAAAAPSGSAVASVPGIGTPPPPWGGGCEARCDEGEGALDVGVDRPTKRDMAAAPGSGAGPVAP